MADRTCIVTGSALPRDQLIRIVSGPDGVAVVDLAELPGRGVWVTNSAEALRHVADRGLLRRSIDAQFDDIESTLEQVGHLMRMRAMAAASMARRAGALIGGAGKLAAEGAFDGLLAAPDASEREFRNCPRVWKLAGRVVRLILKRWDRFVADRALLSPPFVVAKRKRWRKNCVLN